MLINKEIAIELDNKHYSQLSYGKVLESIFLLYNLEINIIDTGSTFFRYS